MSMLRRLMLKTQYRKDTHDLASDFYARCLPECEQFDRAVGFFSTEVFSAAPEAFRAFFQAGGRMRVVASPLLSMRDVQRLTRGYTHRPMLARTDRLGLLMGSPSAVRDGLDEVVPWLVAKDLLVVHIARPVRGSERDLYHEKLGLFLDAEGEAVAFGGSANETYSALQRNFEVVDVYRSWEPSERNRVSRKRQDFARLWANATPGLEVVPFARAAREGWLHVREAEDPAPFTSTVPMEDQSAVKVRGMDEVLHLPGHVRLYAHQRHAVRAWLEARGRGVLEMATGSGKTITALAGATKLYELVGGPLAILILCPYLHLVDQWTEEARQFGLDPIPCARGRGRWEAELSARLYNLHSGDRSLVSAVASNDTFRSDAFQEALVGLGVPLLLIGDEMHNLGASGLRRRLPLQAAYRLGLSATPDRRYDPLGTALLTEYFGPTVGEPYTLAHALADGVLTPYVYMPHLVDLTEDELEAYQELTEKISRAFAVADADGDTSGLERLLIRRARLTASAAGKVPLLRTLMESRRDERHTLVYCGDGRVDEEGAESEIRQIEAVTRALGLGLGMRVASYTAETPPERRRVLLDRFSSGDIQALVAIRCLDEGVDVPATRTAFLLASARDPRQYIQRRGRVLRRSPGKAQAEVHDFIVAPPRAHQDPSSPYYATTRRLVGRELERAVEFAELAENGPEALGRLLPLRDRLNLLTAGADDEDVPASP